MSAYDKVRREIERIRRDATVDKLARLHDENLEWWLQRKYYEGDTGKSALQLFIEEHPHNERHIVEYIFRNTQKLRLTTKKLSDD